MKSSCSASGGGGGSANTTDGPLTTVKNGVKSDRLLEGSSFPTIGPALSPGVELSVTIIYITIYSLLFLFVYVQLWMIWYYRHKRFSYQTVFLFTCLIWSGLRTILFSFYFRDCRIANNLNVMLYWLLYCFPVCLQFTMLCLLVLFFAQVVFKARAKYEPSKYKKPVRYIVIAAVVVFIVSNLVCALFVRKKEVEDPDETYVLNKVRVAINDSLFIIAAVCLAACIIKMTKMSSSVLVLEAKGTSVRQAVAASVLIVLLFSSRAVYNFITVSLPTGKGLPGFGYDWINVSDQVENTKNLSSTWGYVSFGIVLFIWEFLPIAIVVVFFRVKRQSDAVNLTDFSTSSHGSKVFFFDNPRRYDSDEDLSQGDARRSLLNSGPYAINGSPSMHSTPSSTPRGTPVHRGSFRSSLLASTRRQSYGAVFSGGGEGEVASPLLVGSVPVRHVVGSVPARAATPGGFPRVRSADHMSSIRDPVMTPPPVRAGTLLSPSLAEGTLQRGQGQQLPIAQPKGLPKDSIYTYNGK